MQYQEVIDKIHNFNYINSSNSEDNVEQDLFEYTTSLNNINFKNFLFAQLISQRTIDNPIINKYLFWDKCINLWNSLTHEQKNKFNNN